MVAFLRASAVLVVVVASCSSPMGPQGDPGPAGPAGPAGTGTAGMCTAPMVACGGACVDVQTNPKHCGACDVVCTNACVGGACCGDGKKNGDEQCDKGDLGGATCAEAAAPGWTGSAACTPSCKLDAKACTTPATQWNDFKNASNWSTFDVGTVNGGARGFNGGVFDGRYVYLVPHYNGGYTGIAARYDTQAGFGTGGSWSVFDVGSVYGNARGFSHGAFDGRYVYFIPSYNGGYHGNVTRYDTKATFGAASSWSNFDVSTLFPSARGFSGAVFDGRYLYLVPNYNGSYFGMFLRYDTQGGFGFSGSWQAFDATTVHPGAKGFVGGVYDGRYIYFTPYNNGSSSGLVMRYDTQGTFGSSGSWEVFDITTVTPSAKGYYGGAFDGRYIYFAPYHNGGSYHGLAVRYDTQAMFGSQAAWSTFDVGMVNGAARGYVGVGFDGRYMYYVPYYNGGHHGTVARFDTMGTFTSATDWSTFDVGSVNGNARGFLGWAFDGRYFYLSPHHQGAGYSGTVARLDAKSVSWLPKGWQYSQY